MNLSEFRISRRPLAVAAVLVGMVSLAIGAHAALNMRSLDAALSVASEQAGPAAKNKPSRVALVIGNGHYPDANAPLTQPINDARALTSALRRDGFDVDVIEDATKDDMDRAIGRLKAKLRPDSVVMLFFGGYGVQVGRESYMIPVDAAIWKESDVRRDGMSIEAVLDAMKEQGACAKLVVVDASRRNPYERRFRTFSHGLAPITAPDNALILTSATPGQVADDSNGQHSVLMSELLANLNSLNAGESNKALADRAAAAEAVFNKTRIAISRASDGAQVPSVSSSLLEDVRFGVTAADAGG
ncbi:caspase family protein [Bradyrhizobium sp. dw_411]|uniref:caspase family protein n=1 Tax=Bradyrhizobium sp. dw_411 TaxID=2720082 RepID=UPI001BCB560F|nr:caspase family protein [Bradyrhizobium sp. dw_411]